MMLVPILFGDFLITSMMLPATTTGDTIDVNSLTLPLQSVATFQTKTSPMESEEQMTDLQTMKADLRAQLLCSDAEITSIKDELAAMKAELDITSNELISVKSELQILKTEHESLKVQINTTILDSISHDVKSNMADIQMLLNDSRTMNNSLKVSATELNQVKDSLSKVSTDLQHHESEVSTEIFTLSSSVNQVQSSLITTLNTVNHVQNNLTTVESQLGTTKSDISVIRSDMASVTQNISGLETTSHGNSQSLTQLSQSLDTKTQNVAFGVRYTGRQTGSHAPLEFENVKYNAGNGFNATARKFTAPVSGTYIFYTQVEVYDSNETTYINLIQSDNIMAKSWGKSSMYIDDIMIPVTTVSYVKQGEQVWVTASEDVYVVNGFQSIFVGALIAVH